MEVGRTFWKAGNLDPNAPFGPLTYLNELAKNGDHEDNGLPCEMLSLDTGQAVCGIHAVGYEFKPVVCKAYPDEDGEPCFREQTLMTTAERSNV
jgi:hypothetical protein